MNVLEGVSSVSSLEQSVKSLGWRRIRVVVSLEHFFGLINFRREENRGWGRNRQRLCLTAAIMEGDNRN